MALLNSTWHHIRRSPFQSLTAVLIIFLSFLSLTLFVIVSDGMASVLNYFETKPEVTIFLRDGLDRSTVENIQKDLASYSNVKSIKFISKEEALSLYKDQNKTNPVLTEMVTSSILPASFEVSVSDPSVLEKISNDYKSKTDVVDEIIYQKDIIKILLNWTNIIRKTGVIIVSSLGIISFIVIFIIIGMKITNRKDEIKISRLLGASKYYVKKPFLLEGTIYGVMGSLFGGIIGLGVVIYFKSQINQFFNPVIFVRNDPSFYLFSTGVEVVLGLMVGYIASWIGVKRYIKF